MAALRFGSLVLGCSVFVACVSAPEGDRGDALPGGGTGGTSSVGGSSTGGAGVGGGATGGSAPSTGGASGGAASGGTSAVAGGQDGSGGLVIPVGGWPDAPSGGADVWVRARNLCPFPLWIRAQGAQ